jgi:serine-type D-Ala-D-Ala carboxypeptidase
MPILTSRPFAGADAILRDALRVRFTAAVLRVELEGSLAFERAYGTVDGEPDAQPIDPGARFDLASLTKVFVATAALRAAADRVLALDTPLGGILPDWQLGDHAPITLRMLLAHNSGMQSGADYRQLLGEDVEAYARTRSLLAAPGERVVYSDLGFIALGTILERAHGRSLSSVLDATVGAMGAQHTKYRPQLRLVVDIPATEDDGWRGRLRGVVHDEKAYLMGGVAGHAGLFGTAGGVARLADAYLAPACGRPSGAVPAGLAREAVAEAAADPVLRRGLGWALKTNDDNSCGRRMAISTFGHTGFTGTCMWADPTRDLSIVLLTNAVYYGRTDIREFRAAICDAVTDAVDAC